jgi:hypothetical protein
MPPTILGIVYKRLKCVCSSEVDNVMLLNGVMSCETGPQGTLPKEKFYLVAKQAENQIHYALSSLW